MAGYPATVRVASSCAKNRREAVQPLPADVAKALAGYLRNKTPGAFVWPGKWRSRAFLMIQADLKDARESWLESAENALERDRREQSDFLVIL